MKKLVFLCALVGSFSFVLSDDSLAVSNDKPLDTTKQNNKIDVTVESSPVIDKNQQNSSDIPANIVVIDKNVLEPIDNPNSSRTTKSTTTTPKPTTTSTTIKTTTTTSTTVAPNTTTSTTTAPPPKPTPAPKPYPKPSIVFWNSSCIMIKMAGQLNLTYETKDSKTTTILYNIPAMAKVHDSDCSNNNTQSMEINWGTNADLNSLGLSFLKNGTNFYLYSIHFEIQIVGDEFPNAKDNQTVQVFHTGNDFKTPVKMSYHCTRMQTFNLTKSWNDTTPVATLKLSDMQIEAFRTDGHSKFSTAKDCDASDTPDIVPIAVGIALIVLILIVLLSYLVARRRSTARGYMSF